MKNRLYILLFTLVLGVSGFPKSAFSQASELNQIGTSTANFLKIGVGARAAGMAGAFVAVADDISSLYWNPGGLGLLKNNEMIFQVNEWLVDTKLIYFGASYKMGNSGTFGVSLYSFNSGDIEETTVYLPDGTGTVFSANSLAAGITFSRMMTDRFSAGLTLKYINETLYREKGTSIAIDVGSVFITNFLNDMKIGFSLSNLGNRMQISGSHLMFQTLAEPGTKYVAAEYATDDWDIPLLFRFGVATNIIDTKAIRLTGSVEVMDSRDFIHRVTSGFELAIKEMIFVRTGYKFLYEENDFTVGAGVKFPTANGMNLRVDYSYDNFGIMEQIQRFSLIMLF